MPGADVGRVQDLSCSVIVQGWSPVLTLHRADRAGDLAAELATVLRTPLEDCFAAEVVAVPAKGVERWLSQRLSTVLGAVTVDGVAANIDFPNSARLVEDAITAAGGRPAEDEPWARERLVWAVLDVIDANLGQPWCTVLARHLGADAGTADERHRAGRRYATAAHLADLFASYGANRPTMMIDWATGRDTDGTGQELAGDLLWQPELWRHLRRRIAEPSPAERLEDACRTLRDDPSCSDLPERVSVFGPTRLTTTQLTVLRALAAHRAVHLWISHPSAQMWANLTRQPAVRRRRDDPTALAVTHPLLASLAREARELQVRLSPLVDADVHHDRDRANDTLLTRLQADIRADRSPTPSAAPDDGTVQVHAGHGAPRQVEILRDALLHLFQQDKTLEPRDVLVMCPDVETFAPLVRASFGGAGSGQAPPDEAGGHPAHRLRVRLADRALRQTNPLLDTVTGLLRLADGRVTASDVLDLASSDPVRTRFAFSDDDVERMREWAEGAGARWGIGDQQRSAYGLTAFGQNTWTAALNRILLGVTADETELTWLGSALPLDDVDSIDIDLAGRFAEFVDRLDAVLGELGRPQTATAWTTALSTALDQLTDVRPRDAWQLAQARRELAAATEHSAGEHSAGEHSTAEPLRLADVRSMLASRLAGRPTRANFATGDLTVCTMVPMRSVPHRVVALLGLDDGVFPRGTGIDGDDILSRDPCLGERDPRSEDRQLLLDAVMAAGDHLLVFYTGADPVTGAVRPPAIPLNELIDVLTVMTGPAAIDGVVTRHPLQPFDRRNFRAVDPVSFDRPALAGARAANGVPVAAPAFLPPALPARTDDVALADLIAFVVHPTQAFVRQRLGVTVPQRDDDDDSDAMSADLDALAKWDIGDRMLAARLAGITTTAFCRAEWRRGTLPPFRPGKQILDDIAGAVESLAAACRPVRAGPAQTLDVAVGLGRGRELTGTVTDVFGHVVARSSYSTLAAKHRLAAWVTLLAVAATGRPGPWRAITIGRGGRRPVQRSTLVAPDDALTHLRRLVDLFDRGRRAPIPVATTATAEYAERRFRGDPASDAMIAAGQRWADRFGDGKDHYVAYVYGPNPRFEQLATTPPLDDERAWSAAPTRFEVLAERLWWPLLGAETLGYL